MKRYLLLALPVIALMGGAAARADVVTCSCDNLRCTYCSTLIKPHEQIARENATYDPSESGNEQLNVFDHEDTMIVTSNSTDCPIDVTEHPSAEIYEQRTITVGGEYTVAAEYSWVVVKGSIGYTGSWKVSGSFAVEQGSKVSNTVDHPVTIPPDSKTKWKAKFYKKTCDVSCHTQRDHACMGDHCGVRQGYMYPDHHQTSDGNSSDQKFASIELEYLGIFAI